MADTNTIDSLGSRIVAAARMAVVLHLKAATENATVGEQKAMIGGTDRCVTDDSLSMSVVRGPSSVVDASNN